MAIMGLEQDMGSAVLFSHISKEPQEVQTKMSLGNRWVNRDLIGMHAHSLAS